MNELLLTPHSQTGPVIGQIIIETQGTSEWRVPAGVRLICAVGVGGGIQSGPAGGLSYRNNIPVTPGEILTIKMGAPSAGSRAFIDTQILRASEVLLHAQHGRQGGLGGKNANVINDGGGNGGRVGEGGTGGGAGGYSGNGGNGGPGPNLAGLDGEGGGGGGGGNFYSNRLLSGGGGGVGLKGQGANGKGSPGNKSLSHGQPGSGGNGFDYGGAGTPYNNSGGGPNQGGKPGIRIIWGEGRAYPNTLTEDL